MRAIVCVAHIGATVTLLSVPGCGTCGCKKADDLCSSPTTDPSTVAELPSDAETPPNVDSLELDVELIPQTTSLWCWAASGEMTMKFLKHGVSQCAQANVVVHNTDPSIDCCAAEHCPNPDEQSACVQSGWPDYPRWGFQAIRTAYKELSWNALTAELIAGRPVAFTWEWNGGGGHMMVARGFKTVSGTKYVLVNDPLSPCQGSADAITYDEYVARKWHHSHWDDFYGIHYGPPQVAQGSSTAPPIKPATGLIPKALISNVQPAALISSVQPTVKPSAVERVNAAFDAQMTTLGPKFSRELGIKPGTPPTSVGRGTPLKMAIVRLDELAAYKSGTDPNALVHDTDAYLVPVHLNGQPVSGVIIADNGTGFKVVSAGLAPLVRAVSAGLANLPSGAPGQNLRLIEIPALHLRFLGYGTAGLKLRPLPQEKSMKQGPLMILQGAEKKLPPELPAETVFLRLQSRARAIPTDRPG